MTIQTKMFHVKGMHCEGCENRVKKILNEMPGVSNVQANHSAGKVELQMTGEVATKNILQKIKLLGFKAKEGEQE